MFSTLPFGTVERGYIMNDIKVFVLALIVIGLPLVALGYMGKDNRAPLVVLMH
jgi:hypothetical protein